MGYYKYQTKRVKGPNVLHTRFKSYNATHGVKGSHTATVDVSRFEDMVFEFLPTLNLGRKRSDPRADLEASRDYLQSEIEALQNQITKRSGSAPVLAGPLADLGDQLKAVN